MGPDAVADGVSPVRDERSVRSAASGSVTDLDREQIKRDAEASAAYVGDDPTTSSRRRLARHCLTLLAALEQAERERDEAREKLLDVLNRNNTTLAKAEARLAKMPALVEALRDICAADGSNAPTWWGSSTSHLRKIAREALAAYEGEQ